MIQFPYEEILQTMRILMIREELEPLKNTLGLCGLFSEDGDKRAELVKK